MPRLPNPFDLTTSALEIHGSNGKRILSLPPLSVSQGELIGIRGPSGAGKSTLLYGLAGLMNGVRGSIRWGDTDIVALTDTARTKFRADHIGMIFQDFHLFEELGALANASIASLFRPRAERKAIETRADDHLNSLGIDSAARTVSSFSGGERQRVAIARALASNSPVLLADEPTASLDRETADRLVDDLITLVRQSGKTFIAVSHDQHLIDRMDRILTITDGKMVDDRRNV